MKRYKHRALYWGGREDTMIPMMGACGEGEEVEGGASSVGSGQSGPTASVPEKPKKTFNLPSLGDLFDKLKGLLPALALGALAAAVIGGAVLMLRKRREGDPDAASAATKNLTPDQLNTWGPHWASILALLGFDIEGARETNRSDNTGDGFDENGLPIPPEFVGQQIVDEDGNLWVYKDPPGAWINFGSQETRYLDAGDYELPIHEDYYGKITDVSSPTRINVDESLASMAEKIGNVADYEYSYPEWEVIYTKNNKDLYTHLVFDGDQSSLTVNYSKDKNKYSDYPHSIVYKLYEPLPANISEKDFVYVVREMAPSYTENVQLIDYVEEDIDAVVLRNPKWDTKSHGGDSYFNARDTKFKSYDELVSSDTNIREAIENEIVSGSFLESIELTGVDYRRWDNFNQFGSIEDRLENFKVKLQRIELFTSQSNSLTGITGTETNQYTSSLQTKVKKIKNEFTPFESYMYFKSSSYISSSIGEFHDNAWPKKSGAGTTLDPYVLYSVSESKAVNWYSEQITSASLYDRKNRNRLLSNLPDHVINDSRNLPMHTFFNMAGEHFDGIWTYINEIPQIYDRRQPLNEGMSRDLIYAVGRSLGFYLNDGQDLIDLPEYYLGQEATGSNPSTFSEASTVAQRDISREIWKRMINNMPFFLKTRGTLRSFKGLINCYGIPSTILRVKEYGGPDPAPDAQPSYFVDRNFTKALELKGQQYIKSTWVNDSNTSRKPDTIEFRFRSPSPSGSHQTIFQAGTNAGGFAITLKDDATASDTYGTVAFRLAGSTANKGNAEMSSSLLPIWDGEFWSVMLTRVSASGAQLTADTTSQVIDYRLYVKKYDEGREKIYLSSYTTMSIHGATSSSWNSSFVGDETAYIGGKGDSNVFGTQFSGSLMEFRYWNTALSESSFNNHVRAPKAFDGNHASASWTDLVLRYSFDDNKALNSDGDIRDTSADQSYIQTGSAQGYTSGISPHFRTVIDKEQMRIPNIGPNRRVSNKIRLESSRLVYGPLSYNQISEVSAYDTAPLDSNKLGIFFSPADVINEDIIRSVANLDFDQYIGDPRDQYKLRYRTLENIATTYWQKYTSPNNFWDYIRLIRYYDTSLFDQLRSFVPARANASLGLLIEPNILERKKEVVGREPNFEDVVVEGAVEMKYSSSANYPTYTSGSVVSGLSPQMTGSYPTYQNVTGSALASLVVTGSYDTYEGSTTSSFGESSLYSLSSSFDGWGSGKEKWGKVDITIGGPEYVFREVMQPNITSSVVSDHNYEYRFFYSSSKASFLDHGYTWDTEKVNYVSRSLVRSDIQSVGHDNAFFRLAYLGSLQTIKTTLDKEPPVSITVTSPTTLVTSEPGESKLKVK